MPQDLAGQDSSRTRETTSWTSTKRCRGDGEIGRRKKNNVSQRTPTRILTVGNVIALSPCVRVVRPARPAETERKTERRIKVHIVTYGNAYRGRGKEENRGRVVVVAVAVKAHARARDTVLLLR